MKIAVVTGASSGLGREFVKQLPYFYHGLDQIWVTARRGKRLTALAKDVRVPLRIFEGDLLREEVFSELEGTLRTEKPDIRILVNAAGFGKTGALTDISGREPKAQSEMISLNCTALTRITEICIPRMSHGSRIVNLASAAAFCPQPFFSVYAATKAYVLSFSQALGAELKRRGIFVTAVCPGPVNTEFFTVSGRLTNPWKKLVMADPVLVVKKALKDVRKRKQVSVYGCSIKAARLAAGLLPEQLLVKIEMMGKN